MVLIVFLSFFGLTINKTCPLFGQNSSGVFDLSADNPYRLTF